MKTESPSRRKLSDSVRHHPQKERQIYYAIPPGKMQEKFMEEMGMSTIEKINRYISNTTIQTTKAGASVEDIIAIANGMDRFRAVSLAFMYGRAKGYRAAKAEGREK